MEVTATVLITIRDEAIQDHEAMRHILDVAVPNMLDLKDSVPFDRPDIQIRFLEYQQRDPAVTPEGIEPFLEAEWRNLEDLDAAAQQVAHDVDLWVTDGSQGGDLDAFLFRLLPGYDSRAGVAQEVKDHIQSWRSRCRCDRSRWLCRCR